ncbi:MAG: PAS domain-containing protein [Leptolyngbya sp. BL-A-14]
MATAKRYTVLLIDDSAEDRAVYCRYLQRGAPDRYQILEADSAASGLDLFQRQHPDVVLLDYSLPDRDGLEVLALLQQDEKQRVPVLMLTGQGNETIAAQAIKQGAQDYLIKGNLTAGSLCKALQHAIEQFQLQQRLARQEQQQRILSAIALRIHRALNLQTILDTSVAEVRQALGADRVVIYQFAPDMNGRIVAEAVLPEWSKSLHTQIEDTCFRENRGGDYRLGKTRAINNVYDANLTDCHLRLLERFQVKANLVVPLLLVEQDAGNTEGGLTPTPPQLWGLLVVHQCSTTRQWLPFETELLNQVAVRMAIAIQQAELYHQLQNELAERQRIEAALGKSEQRYRSLVTATTQAVWTADAEGKTNEDIPGWRALTGQTEAEASGWGWMDAIHPEDRAKTAEAWRIATTTKTLYEVEHRIRVVNGDYRFFIGRAAPVLDESGNIREWIGAHTDITEAKRDEAIRQQIESALRSSEEQLRLALDFNQIGSWDWNILTNQLSWNENHARLLGLDPQHCEVSYETWHDRVHPEDIDRVEAAIQQALSSRTRFAEDYRVRHPDGTLHWMTGKGQAIYNEAGQPLRMIGVMLDITDRKQAETALQQLNQELEARVQERTATLQASEARLREAQRIARLGDWEFDLTTQKIIWSQELFRLFELDSTQGEPTYTEHLQSFFPESRAQLEQAVEQAVTLGKPYELELQFRRADGSAGWVLGRGEAVRNEQGAVVKLFGTALDISRRKQAEQAVRESEHRFATLAAAAPDAIFRFDASLNCVYANQRWSEMTGRPTEAGMGWGWVDTIHPEDRAQTSTDVAQWFQTHQPGDVCRHEARILRPDGSVVWYFCQMLPETDASGAMIGYVGTLTDISDRKQAEAQLHQVSNRLTLAIKSGSIGIWDWNVVDNVLTWDERMHELYGIPPNQFTNLYEAWANSLHPDDRLLAETAIQQALAGEKDYDPEFRVLHPDGTIRFIKAYALVERNEQGEPQQMIGINYDITERKQAEEALQQLTVDLQRSNQELEQFAYVASHDLQEPLRAITSYTQLFAKRYQGQIDEKADKYIHYVIDGAARMQQLIQDLLAYSRVGRYELKLRPTDCNGVLQQVTKDLQMTIDETSATLIVDPLPTILGDSMQVAQLFQNLIGNALKYRGQAPPIIRVSAREQGDDWLFSIQDNGIGIEPQYAQRIFEIFQRLHTRREYEGTGLGLAICKKIVERHHGSIWVEPQLGQGSVFCFTLPALPGDEHVSA